MDSQNRLLKTQALQNQNRGAARFFECPIVQAQFKLRFQRTPQQTPLYNPLLLGFGVLPQDVEFLGKKGPKAKALRWPCTTSSWESNGSKWHDMGMTGHKTKLGLFKKIQYHNLIFKY